MQAALERLPPSLLQASAILAHVHDKPFAMWCCRWQSRYCRWLYLYLLTHAGRFYCAQLVGPPGYFIGNMVYSQQGALAICRWRRHSPWCRLFSSHLHGVRETSGSVRCTLNAHRFPQTGGLGRRGFPTFSHPDYRAYAFNTEDAAFSFPPQGLTRAGLAWQHSVVISLMP